MKLVSVSAISKVTKIQPMATMYMEG